MLPSQYPVFLALYESPTDYIVVENQCTDEKHMLLDWNGVSIIEAKVVDGRGVRRLALTSKLIGDLAKNPENKESALDILRAKLKKNQYAKNSIQAQRTVYRIGKCEDEGA